LGLPWVVTFGGQVSSGISPITLSPTTLPNGTVGATYNQTITAIGGTAPDAFAVSFGVLPSGLALSLSGELSGTPRIADSFTFTLQATDSNGCVGTQPYTVVITASPTIVVGTPTVSPSRTNEGANTSFSVNGTFTDSAGASEAPLTVSVDWGDGGKS